LAKERNVPVSIFWDPPESVADSKVAAITQLAGAMKRGLVQFATSIPYREELIYRQFERWSPSAKRRKDDAPDCLAQIWKRFSPQIFPHDVNPLQPSEPVPFVPEISEPVVTEVDNHADELLYADMDRLRSMTVPHV